jgi:hypothetical protein
VTDLLPGEYDTLLSNLETIIGDLDQAILRSRDPADRTMCVARKVKTGRRGRPRVVIDREWLRMALQLRGPQGIAASLPFKVCPRTVRNIALQYGLVQPGNPVFINETLDDGSVARTWHGPTGSFSPLSDEELDALVFEVLQSFPNYGRAMVTGELLRRGHRIQRFRLRESYVRVHGTPRVWGQRNIPRRPYRVAGPNSLWHHDGQHGESFYI